MSVEIAWKQNNLVTDFHLLKLLQAVFGLGLQAFVSDFSRQNICSVVQDLEKKLKYSLNAKFSLCDFFQVPKIALCKDPV